MNTKTKYNYHSPRVPISCDCPKLTFYETGIHKKTCKNLANKMKHMCIKNSKNAIDKCNNISNIYKHTCYKKNLPLK